MSKEITFKKDGFDKIIAGFDKAAEAVAGTIGPKGLNVYVDGQYTPEITNDGATIAGKIVLKDKLEDAGAYIIRNVSGQQNDDVGDGTTTVSVLTHSIVHEALNRPENPMVIKESLKEAGEKILKILAEKSVKIEQKDVEKVALISAEDKDLARLITEIFCKLGEKAVINVDDSKTFGTDYEIVDGYEAGVGFVSPHFMTDKKSGKAVYENIPVLVSEKKISNIIDIKPIFDQLDKEQIRSCVIVCEDIDDAMLGMLVVNKNMGNFNSLVIRANGWLLEDIEGAVGATAISDRTGITFQNVKLSHLGKAKKVVCDANKTVFTTDGISAKELAKNLEDQAEGEKNQFTQKTMRNRAAKLRGGIAVLRIGAPTDFEREYLKRKAEDSIKATQAALEEGVVEGGGMVLWRISQGIVPQTVGDEILKRSMTAPLRRIIQNCGKDYSEIILNMPQGMGYDAKNDKYVNMTEAGILDPTKVERCALENAISAASTFITTNAVITESPNEKN